MTDKPGDPPRGPASEPVPAVPAATLVLMREAPDGMEVLLVRRNRSAGFVPGAYVFPGGRVDSTDAEPAVLERLDGLTPQRAAARMNLADGDPPAIAYYVAALREAFEETGIPVALTRDDRGPATAAEDAEVDRMRNDLMADAIAFAGLLERLRCRVDGAAVEYLAHWITPESEPRRFDTRFFAAQVSARAEAIVDRREMTEALWIAPAAAVEEHGRDRLPMIMPTIRTLEQLRAYGSPREALEALPELEVPRILPDLEAIPSDIGLRQRRHGPGMRRDTPPE